MASDASRTFHVTRLPTHEAYDLIDAMTNAERTQADALLVVSGRHPVHNDICVVVAPLGESVVIPIVSRALIL